MKKLFVLVLCLLLLCACTPSNSQQDTQPSTKPAQTEGTQPEVTEGTEPNTEEPTDVPTEGQDADPFDLAQSCIGETVDKLFELIGEPDTSDYAPSCLGPGEDGNLYYDSYGFTVYTYKEDGVETVRVVE